METKSVGASASCPAPSPQTKPRPSFVSERLTASELRTLRQSVKDQLALGKAEFDCLEAAKKMAKPEKAAA